MAFDVSALANYTDEQRDALIIKQQLSGKTAQIINVVPGIKGPTALNKLDTTVTFQAGGCGFNALDTTSLSNRILTPGQVKINEKLCPKDLKTKWTVSKLKQGTRAEKEQIPFEKEYSEAKAMAINAAIELGLWQGDTGSGNANLNKWDGFIKIIDAAGTAISAGSITGTGTVSITSGSATVTGVGTAFSTQGIAAGDKLTIAGVHYTVQTVGSNTSITLTANSAVTAATQAFTFTKLAQLNLLGGSPVTAVSSSNANTVLTTIYNTIPVAVLEKGNVAVLVGMDWFRAWTTQITNLNLFNYTADNSNFELIIPGTNVKVIALNGLNGTNRAYAGQLDNFFYGVDLLGEEESFKIWYSQDNDEVRFSSEFTAGVQVGTPSEITEFKLAA